MAASSEDGSWLPPELFSAIFDRLSSVDRCCCRCVCKSWSSAAKKKPLGRPALQSPWLMLSHPTKGCTFYDVLDNKSYHMALLPERDIRKRSWIGSSNGWLITVDRRSEMHLLNPMTRAQIPLPSIISLPSVTAVHDRRGRVRCYLFRFEPGEEEKPIKFSPEKTRDYLFCMGKAVVSWSTSDSNDDSWTVMLMFMPCSQLAYARAGDDVWTTVADCLFVQDLVLCDGLFYTVDSAFCVKVWNSTSLPSPVRTVDTDFVSSDYFSYFRTYLAISSPSAGKQELLLVRRETDVVGEDMYGTLSFEVYTLLDDDHHTETDTVRRWARVQSLGDQAMFLGNNSSTIVFAQDFPELKQNCIYFTDDYWELVLSARGQNRDIGVCNLEDGTITPCYPQDIPKLNWPPPIWITPSFQWTN